MRSDEALLEALLDGDIRGFDLLYQRYERPLFGFIRRHHPGWQDAEDVLHETFLALLRDRDGARSAASLRAWLFQVARNLCLNRHRTQRRARQALSSMPHVLGTADAHPDGILERAEKDGRLRGAIASLPVDLAELYQLRVGGLSYDEMASVLAVPLGTVKSRMHSMVRRLQEVMRREL